MMYGLDMSQLTNRQKAEQEVAELKILKFSLGLISIDRNRNQYIRGTTQVERFGDKVVETWLRWSGHVQRRKGDILGKEC